MLITKYKKSDLENKKLIVFDLDGTLTESKTDLDLSMSQLLFQLLGKKKMAIIGGGSYSQFQKQFVAKLGKAKGLLSNLFLFPTTSMSFYRYHSGVWKNVYAYALTQKEKKEIYSVFPMAFEKINYVRPKKLYGKDIEDRITQISFSPLGRRAPIKAKEAWREKNDKSIRRPLAKILQKFLPHFEVKVGGITTIDITRKGVDKAYGIRQIEKNLHVPIKDMLFVGDALFPGGNDYAALKTGVQCIKVSGPKETKKVIKVLLEK
jgi:hypothetical protein